jgi:uncharacterized protein YkwD
MPLRFPGKLIIVLLLSACTFPPAPPTPFYRTPPAVGSPGATSEAVPAASQTLPASASSIPATGTATLTEGPPIATSPPASPGTAAQTGTAEASFRRSVLMPVAQEIVGTVNNERVAQGLPALTASPVLMGVAFERSEDMVARGYFGHEDPEDGSTLAWSLLVGAGFGGRLGESIFATPGNLEDVASIALAAWLSSPAHRDQILNPAFHYTGVGLMGDGTVWKVTQVFAESSFEAR